MPSGQFLLKNWHLNTWCHKSNDFRTFALDRIKNPKKDH
jgi:predicted DNA-binding transcriptional regulator YafY